MMQPSAFTALFLLVTLTLITAVHRVWAWTSILPLLQSRACSIHRQHHRRYRYAHGRAHKLSSSTIHTSSDTDDAVIINSILAEIEETSSPSTVSFPLLRIGKRVGSGSYGTVHRGYILNSREEDVMPCITKRAWTLSEIKADIPSQILKLEQDNRKQRQNRQDSDDNNFLVIAQRTGLASSSSDTNRASTTISSSDLRHRVDRCQHYWDVERHCYQKMANRVGEAVPPLFLGVYRDDEKCAEAIIPGYGETSTGQKQTSNDTTFGLFGSVSDGNTKNYSNGHEWMVFEFVGSAEVNSDESRSTPAQTLLDAMERDWMNQHQEVERHPLNEVRKALNLPGSYKLGETLDVIFTSILENLKRIHELNIVHRDLKPGNLLCDGNTQQLRLFDFGSAADLDPSPIPPEKRTLFSGATRRVGYDEGITAVSPAYCAPETFIKLNENPLAFDVFSAGLLMSQLLFNLLDERSKCIDLELLEELFSRPHESESERLFSVVYQADAGYLQRMKDVNYDLDEWLENELRAKLRPSGLNGGLEYLNERRGLWSLLKQMFQPDPMKRVSSSIALEKLKQILAVQKGDTEWNDLDIATLTREEAYFETVIESLESCILNIDPENMPRPLHFLASFEKGAQIGLILAESSEVGNDGSMSSAEWEQWRRATERALPGEVYVRGWDELSQAGRLGIFEIGDRLRGVGEIPFVDGGFEQAINLINRQPKNGSLKLHFDRMPSPKAPTTNSDQLQHNCIFIKVGDQGAWKSGGRRGNQEDAFVLHEIKMKESGEDILLAGVFDGHAGAAASETASGILPALFTSELLSSSEKNARVALEKSWETTCNTYRSGCDDNGECIAAYDPVEGILFAETGSKDLVAGTTATIATISMSPSGTNELIVLNCGDSRTLVIGQPITPIEGGASVIVFETRDHSPDDEIEIHRLEQGSAAGLDYSVPQCSTNGSYMVVGDYQYALCRSLEGTFVTSKGIVSDPDISTLDIASSLADRRHCALLLACDGLFEVMSNEEVGREVVRMRREGYKAGDIAKNLCGQALKKGSYDNLSVVVVYLDHIF